MKKGLLTMVVALICAMTCAFGLVACNNDTLDGETTEVKGKTYTFVELSVAYSPDFPDSEKADEDAMTALFTGTTLTFGTDGTFEQEALQQTGTYTQNKNEITFTVSDDTFTGMVSGNDLILSDKMELSDSIAFVTTSIKYTLSTSSQTVAVESVTLNKTTLTMDIGDEETLTATVAPNNATNKTVTWSSSDNAVATVENGKVTAIAAGTATITAKAGDKTDTCSVTVNAAEPTVNGKTFIFYDLTSDDLSSEMLATMKSQMENVTIVFTNEGTFTITQTIDTTTIVQTGSYEQKNSSVLMAVETMTSNGRPVEGSDENLPISLQGTFDGEQLSYSSEVMPDTFVTNIFVLKTN